MSSVSGKSGRGWGEKPGIEMRWPQLGIEHGLKDGRGCGWKEGPGIERGWKDGSGCGWKEVPGSGCGWKCCLTVVEKQHSHQVEAPPKTPPPQRREKCRLAVIGHTTQRSQSRHHYHTVTSWPSSPCHIASDTPVAVGCIPSNPPSLLSPSPC